MDGHRGWQAGKEAREEAASNGTCQERTKENRSEQKEYAQLPKDRRRQCPSEALHNLQAVQNTRTNTPSLQVLVDGPSSDSSKVVPRHATALAHVALTHIVIPNIPLAAGTGAIKKQWEAASVDSKWAESAWAQSRARSSRRRALTDFERFKVLRLRKQQRFEVRKSVAKAVKASA